MATLAIAAATSVAGNAVLSGTVFGLTGAQLGFMAGSIIGNYLFGPKGQNVKGPRLTDTVYTGQVEGTDIPILWGSGRLPGKPIWIKTPPKEVKKKDSTGGKGGSTGSVTTYTYYQDFLVCFGEYIAYPPRRVWINNELVYDASGSNSEILDVNFQFTWYNGEEDTVDAIIEQDVGVGNSPSYKGRSCMMIEQLNLTQNYGNRLPVIEIESHTSATLSTALTSYNMGVSDDLDYSNTDYLLPHPSLPTYLSTPGKDGTARGLSVFFTDMASQQSYQIFNLANTDMSSFCWYTDPFLYEPNNPPYFVYSGVCLSCSTAYLYLIEYPTGKLNTVFSFTAGSGGAKLGEDTRKYLIWGQVNSGVGIGLFDKQIQTVPFSDSVNNMLSDTGWTSNNFSESATTIDWVNSIWGMVAQKGTNSTRYFVFDASTGTPTLTEKSNMFELLSPGNSTDFAIAGLGVGYTRGIYVEEYNEIWWPYYTTTPVSGFDLGLICLNATTGALVTYIDFVEGGYTTGASYFGIASGYPHLTFEPQQRRIWCTMSSTNDVISVQVDSRNVDVYSNSGAGSSWTVSYPNRNSIWSGEEVANEYIIRERKLNLVTPNTIAISDILIDMFERAGYTASDYDVSNLTTKTINGFIHGSRHSFRSDIELLLGLVQADGIQSDYKLKFPIRGSASVLTIPNDDLATQEIIGEVMPKDSVIISDPTGIEIPKILELEFISVANNYNPGLAQSYIATGDGNNNISSQLPVALTEQQAFDLAEINHQQMNTAKTVQFSLPIKYSYLEPTDVVEVPKNNENHRVRLTKIDRGANWILKCEGVIENDTNYVSTAVIPGVDDFLATIQTRQLPIGIIFDGPLLDDSHSDHPGPYLVSYVSGDNYPPSVWYYSVDNSVFADIFTQDTQPLVGQAQDIMDTEFWEEWNDAEEIYVVVVSDGSVSSSTKSAIEADPTINAFAYGKEGRWEYLNAATITTVQTSPNKIIKLSNLLRGRRGTNNYINTHEEKDLVVQLNTTIQRQGMQNSQIGNDFYYKIVRSGEAVSDFSSISYTNEGQQLFPYSPINLSTVDDAGDLDSTWTRRTRKGGSLGGDNSLTDGVGGPISEDSLLYEIDYVKVSDESILRTETGLTTEAATYTAANQTTDGVDLLGQIYVDVYQISAVVGRGFRSRYLYDKGWGSVINEALELGAVGIMPLDDADGASAREVISDTTPGTYTSASLGGALSADNLGSLDGDSTGYMKTGKTLSNLLFGENQVTVIAFTNGAGVTNDRILEITQGGSQTTLELYWSSATTIGSVWSPKDSTAGPTGTWGDITEQSLSQVMMIAAVLDLNSTFTSYGYVNGVLVETLINSTGHAAYNATIDQQTRDINYDDTVGGTIDSTPTNLKSTGSVGFILIFDRILTTTEQRSIFTKALSGYDDLIRSEISLHTQIKLDLSIPRANKGPIDYTNHGAQMQKRSITFGSEYGAYFDVSNDAMYANLPDAWRTNEFTVEFFIYFTSTLVGWRYLFAMEPVGWTESSVKKGVHIYISAASGLTASWGEGGASFNTISQSTVNMSPNNLYHVAASFHETNGVKLYLNGTEIANNSGTSIDIDWTDAGSRTLGPDVATTYINAYNNYASGTQTYRGDTGIAGRYNDFAFYLSELPATTILNHYRRGAGIVV